MIWTIILLVITAAPVLYRGAQGWIRGATSEMRYVLVYLFAVLLAVRFWQPGTDLLQKGLTFDPRYVAIGVYLLLFMLAAAVAGVAIRIKADLYRSVIADPINQILGLAGGLFSGALLGASLALILSLAIPARIDEADSPILESVILWPETLATAVATHVAGISPESESRLKFPRITFSESPLDAKDPASATAAPGAILVQLYPTLTWE